MALVQKLLPVFTLGNKILGQLGFSPFAVSVVTTGAWTGGRPGKGTIGTVTTTAILEAGQNPPVEEVSTREIIASAGKYRDQDLKVGPITPAWGPLTDGRTGGTDLTVLDPDVPGGDVHYTVTGPGIPAGSKFEKVELRTTDPTGYTLVLRRTGQA